MTYWDLSEEDRRITKKVWKSIRKKDLAISIGFVIFIFTLFYTVLYFNFKNYHNQGNDWTAVIIFLVVITLIVGTISVCIIYDSINPE